MSITCLTTSSTYYMNNEVSRFVGRPHLTRKVQSDLITTQSVQASPSGVLFERQVSSYPIGAAYWPYPPVVVTQWPRCYRQRAGAVAMRRQYYYNVMIVLDMVFEYCIISDVLQTLVASSRVDSLLSSAVAVAHYSLSGV